MRILVVEDDPDAQANLRDILELDDYRVETAATAAEALARADWSDYAAIILDRRLPDGNANDLLPKLKQAAPELAVIVVTGYSDLEGAILALRLGAADYILKPINADSLRLRLSRIIEQRRLTRAKERSEAAFRQLVEAAECLIVMLRPDFSIVYFSPFAEQLTGYTAAEVLGRNHLELFLPAAFRAAAAERYRRVLSGTPMHEFESPLLCRDGAQRWLIRNARCLPDYEGAAAILIVGNDITELKQAQDRAVQAERLAAIGQMVAGLAHESRNALQRSQACLEMLALKVSDRAGALDLIARIQRAQDDLHHLFDDVRGYAAPIRLERRPCNLAEVWREAWGHLAAARRGRQACLGEQVDGVDLHCNADPFRLEQVFRNILDNALAACHNPVEIAIRAAEARFDDRPAVRVAVRDNGPGLSPEQAEKLFEPFYTTKTRGTGLGMAIVKRIVDAHGGRIEVGDQAGPGAEIVLTLPRGAS
jgi:PAS domain S-box-containing protein